MQLSRHIQPRVFVSYSHQDESLAKQLVIALRERGADVWQDIEELTPGDNLYEQISAAIRGSDIFLVLISPKSVHSQWVQRELKTALATENRTRVVPILVDNTEMPQDIADVLYLVADSSDLSLTAEQILREAISSPTETDVVRGVEEILSVIDVEWQRAPAIAGVRPDFLVESIDGKRIVIEAKSRPNPGLLEVVDASSQAARIRDLTEADHSVVVFPTVGADFPEAGIVGLPGLGEHLRDLLQSLQPLRVPPASRPKPKHPGEGDDKTVFASMPFDPQYEDVYWVAMTVAAEAIGATCVRVDREDFEGDIAAKIKAEINSCVAVIADLSGSNPDVLYEVGYAHSRDCPCVHICSTNLDDLPFNVRNINTLFYEPGRTHSLREPLTRRLRAVLEKDLDN